MLLQLLLLIVPIIIWEVEERFFSKPLMILWRLSTRVWRYALRILLSLLEDHKFPWKHKRREMGRPSETGYDVEARRRKRKKFSENLRIRDNQKTVSLNSVFFHLTNKINNLFHRIPLDIRKYLQSLMNSTSTVSPYIFLAGYLGRIGIQLTDTEEKLKDNIESATASIPEDIQMVATAKVPTRILEFKVEKNSLKGLFSSGDLAINGQILEFKAKEKFRETLLEDVLKVVKQYTGGLTSNTDSSAIRLKWINGTEEGELSQRLGGYVSDLLVPEEDANVLSLSPAYHIPNTKHDLDNGEWATNQFTYGKALSSLLFKWSQIDLSTVKSGIGWPEQEFQITYNGTIDRLKIQLSVGSTSIRVKALTLGGGPNKMSYSLVDKDGRSEAQQVNQKTYYGGGYLYYPSSKGLEPSFMLPKWDFPYFQGKVDTPNLENTYVFAVGDIQTLYNWLRLAHVGSPLSPTQKEVRIEKLVEAIHSVALKQYNPAYKVVIQKAKFNTFKKY